MNNRQLYIFLDNVASRYKSAIEHAEKELKDLREVPRNKECKYVGDAPFFERDKEDYEVHETTVTALDPIRTITDDLIFYADSLLDDPIT